MVRIEELMRKKEAPVFMKVTGRANQEHVLQAQASGISTDIIIEAAFKEVYEQLQAKNLLKSIAPKGSITESVKRPPERGEPVFYEGWMPEKGSTGKTIMNLLRHHIYLTTAELKEMLSEVNPSSVSFNIFTLRAKGLIVAEGKKGEWKYCLKENQGKSLEGMLPKGALVSVGP